MKIDKLLLLMTVFLWVTKMGNILEFGVINNVIKIQLWTQLLIE